MLEALVEHPLLIRLGWTLLHSLWQGVALAGVAWLGMLLLGPSRHNVRHALATLVAIFWLAAPAVTFVLHPMMATASTTGTANPVNQTADQISTTGAARQPARTEGASQVLAGARGFAATESQTLRSWVPYTALAWLVIATVLSLRLLGGMIVAHRLRRGGTPLPVLEVRFRTLTNRLGLKRPVRLLASARVDVPTAVGWLRPVVLLPASAITGLSPAQLDLILAHELAHIKRHDYLINVLLGATQALLFFHPFTWWLANTLQMEREHACDDLALTATGAPPLELAESLARLETQRAIRVPMLAATSNLTPRIRRLLGAARPARVRTPVALPALALAPLVMWLALSANASAATDGLFERYEDGVILSPYMDAPMGGWENIPSLAGVQARATFPLAAPTILPEGFRFATATWDENIPAATFAYQNSYGDPTRALTLMQTPADGFVPLPVGLDAELQSVRIGPAGAGGVTGVYVSGHWSGHWAASPPLRQLTWRSGTGQILAWQDGETVFMLGLDQVPHPGVQPLPLQDLLEVAASLVPLGENPSNPVSRQPLPAEKHRIWATLVGEVTAAPDYDGLSALDADARVIIEERDPLQARRVVITRAEGGQFQYDYTVNGEAAPLEGEALDWYGGALEAAVMRPLRTSELDQRSTRYRWFNEGPEGYVSLIAIPEDPYYVEMPDPQRGVEQDMVVFEIEALSHAAAHHLINQGMFQVALHAYLAEAALTPEQVEAFRYAAEQIVPQEARRRFLERLDL